MSALQDPIDQQSTRWGPTSSDSADRRILVSAFGAFYVFIVQLIEALLVKRMFAMKVDRGQAQITATDCTALGLEDSRLGTHLFDFCTFRTRLAAVAFDKATILNSVSMRCCVVD